MAVENLSKCTKISLAKSIHEINISMDLCSCEVFPKISMD